MVEPYDPASTVEGDGSSVAEGRRRPALEPEQLHGFAGEHRVRHQVLTCRRSEDVLHRPDKGFNRSSGFRIGERDGTPVGGAPVAADPGDCEAGPDGENCYDERGPGEPPARAYGMVFHSYIDTLAISIAFAPPASNTVPVTLTLCSACGLSLAFSLSPGIPALTGM